MLKSLMLMRVSLSWQNWFDTLFLVYKQWLMLLTKTSNFVFNQLWLKNAKITVSVSLKVVSLNHIWFCFSSYLMQKPFASLSNTRFPPFSLLCRVSSYSAGYASSCSPICTRELSVTIWVCRKEWEKKETFWVLLLTLFLALKQAVVEHVVGGETSVPPTQPVGNQQDVGNISFVTSHYVFHVRVAVTSQPLMKIVSNLTSLMLQIKVLSLLHYTLQRDERHKGFKRPQRRYGSENTLENQRFCVTVFILQLFHNSCSHSLLLTKYASK